ncbi:MAG: hypothetical protein JNM36_11440, partial [Chitinophagales bacterium]|nr:hypothetical protein [Chitinophagales bacterium]
PKIYFFWEKYLFVTRKYLFWRRKYLFVTPKFIFFGKNIYLLPENIYFGEENIYLSPQNLFFLGKIFICRLHICLFVLKNHVFTAKNDILPQINSGIRFILIKLGEKRYHFVAYCVGVCFWVIFFYFFVIRRIWEGKGCIAIIFFLWQNAADYRFIMLVCVFG